MQKIYLLTLFCSIISFAQEWEFKGYYNGDSRHHPITFSNERYGFVIAGQNDQGDYLNDVFRYDSEQEIWEQLSNFPGGPRGYSYGVSNELFAYVGFGSNENGYPNDFWRYDIVNNLWQELSSFPDIGRNHPAMILVNDKIYIGLGSVDGENLGDWWEYSITQNTWTEKASFNYGDRHHPFYFSIGDYAYVGFGHGNYINNNINIYNDFYKYNPESNEWIELNNFPSEARVAGTQFSFNNKGYVLSGDGDDHGPLDSGELWEYNPENDQWFQLNSHPGGARWAPGSFVIDCHIYLTSGYEGETDTYYNDLIKFKLSDDCGCTNVNAFNYNLSSTIDDGSCCYISGCTNSESINYNQDACYDDGSCIPIVLGCDNILASNYNESANLNISYTGPDYLELGTGGYHYNDLWNMEFTCYENVNIKTIDLISETNFNIQIEIIDNNNNQLYLQDFNLITGLNQIELNAEILTGENYQIGIIGENQGLYRNNNISSDVFPINLLNVIEITSNTTDSPIDYYYYFYNWQLEINCENISGCTNLTACNYNQYATDDDGSCEYIGDDCIISGSIGPDFEFGVWNENCECSHDNSNLNTIYKQNKLNNIYDVLGKNTFLKNAFIFEIYDNGMVNKKFFIK